MKPTAILPLAFLCALSISSAAASPFSFLWGPSESPAPLDLSPGFYNWYSHELWANNETRKAGGYGKSQILSAQTTLLDELKLGAALGRQTHHYELDYAEAGKANWLSEDASPVTALALDYRMLRLELNEQLQKQYGKILISISDDFSAFYTREQQTQPHQISADIPAETDNIRFDLSQDIDLEWNKAGLTFSAGATLLTLEKHFEDPDEITTNQADKRWNHFTLRTSPSQYGLMIDYQFTQYNIPQQAFFFDGVANGSGSGHNSIEQLQLAVTLDETIYHINLLNADLNTEGLFNAQALSAHYLSPLLGAGLYQSSLQLNALTLIKGDNPASAHSNWSLGYGLGYLEMDGLNKETIFANPFGIYLRTEHRINTESALWGIVKIGYRWSYKNIHIGYQMDQILPLAVTYRTEHSASSGSNGNSSNRNSSSLKWPLQGSRQRLSFNYLFD